MEIFKSHLFKMWDGRTLQFCPHTPDITTIIELVGMSLPELFDIF